MKKVITYGTYDLLHYGHIRLLERARELGDYLIVGVTADDFDKTRGKINVQQSLSERIEAVRKTGIADEIIAEEYEGQKIDDIIKYDVDIFTVGSDWVGYFDYLNEYCEVVYLPRTEGVSSSEIREKNRAINLGLVGNTPFINKVASESQYVNGICLSGIFADDISQMSEKVKELYVTHEYKDLLCRSEAIYIKSHPDSHYSQIKEALEKGIHVLCEAPISLDREQCNELYTIAENNNCILTTALKTAYSTAFHRLLLLIKGGKIGKVVSIDATCTSLDQGKDLSGKGKDNYWNPILEWGPTALLPVFQILGTKYRDVNLIGLYESNDANKEIFAKIDLLYSGAVASIKVGSGVKSEGELIISGTKGYVFVPAPWWKTDYFEIRYENPADNRRYFYQLDGEGIRSELASFLKSIEMKRADSQIPRNVSTSISEVINMFVNKRNVDMLH